MPKRSVNYIHLVPKRKHKSLLDRRIGWGAVFLGFVLIALAMVFDFKVLSRLPARDVVLLGFIGLYAIISLQAFLTLYWSLYAWNDPDEVERNQAPKVYDEPNYSFTALLPARHEEAVIAETIRSIARINYPDQKKELLVLIRHDDTGTITAAQTAINELGNPRIRLVIVNDTPVNKPNQLNWGLAEASHDVLVVFDAEDSPSAEIYNIVNTVMLKKHADVVQSGVQLMNFRSNWFSAFNVLEYYFWFKSALHFFSKRGVVPLGGNTVFFKRDLIVNAGGWDEFCLTEDAEIGMRLSQAGAKIAIVYDERHATQEETPPTLSTFIKQRTRWNLGFLQIFSSGLWLQFPKLSQKLLAGYMLILPQLVLVLLAISPLISIVATSFGLPLGITLFSFLPLGLLFLQLVVLQVGLWQFTRDYKVSYPLLTPLRIFLGFVPFIIILAFSAGRALWRFTLGNLAWEKTVHINAHRATAPAPHR